MILSTHQPYFAPYPGFFQKAAASDAFVLLDSVPFPQGTTWLQRNRFKNHQGELRLTVPVRKKGLAGQPINEVEILWDGGWPAKHLQSLTQAYAHAPYLREHLPFLRSLYNQTPKRLVDLNLAILKHMAGHLLPNTPVYLLSDLPVRGRGTELILNLCRHFGAGAYLAQKGAERLLQSECLRRDGLDLRVFKPESPVYPQLWGHFLPNLSALDLLMNIGSHKGAELLGTGTKRP